MTAAPSAPPADAAGTVSGAGALGPAALAVHRELLRRLSSGVLPDDSRLGGERELATELGVSRSTVRAALDALAADGAVRRVPGRGGGTFARTPQVTRDLSRISGVPAMLIDQGFQAGSRVVEAALLEADAPTRRALDLPIGAWVVSLVRVRLADGRPLSLDHARFPADLVPGLLDRALSGSLYDLLRTDYGLDVVQTDERLQARPADADQARALLVPPGSPVLCVHRVARTTDGRAVEYSYDVFRGDRTVVTVRTREDGAGRSTGPADESDLPGDRPTD